MWLHGNAGCGKTILCSALLQSILQRRDSHPDTAIGFFYFYFNDTEKQSSSKAIRSLTFQLALQIDGLPNLEKLYEKCENGNGQPAEDAIESLLRNTAARAKHAYIVLDAIDECTDRESLLVSLKELIDVQGLCIIATSQREKDIKEQFSPVAKYNINIENTLVDEDIFVYTRDRVAADLKLKRRSPTMQEDIITVVTGRADGMYGCMLNFHASLADSE